MNQEPLNVSRPEAENLVRMWNLFYNRTISYSFDHPHVQELITKVFEAFLPPLSKDGELSILFQEFGYYIGSVDLVYHPTNRKIADHLRRFGIEAISFDRVPELPEFTFFLDACSLTHADPNSFLRYLSAQNVSSISVNNVSLRTMKEGDRVVSQSARNDVGAVEVLESSPLDQSSPPKAKSPFADMAMRVVLGHITAKEMNANLGLLQMLESPGAISDAMVQVSTQAKGDDQAIAMRQSLLNVVGAFKTSAAQESISVEEMLAGMYKMRGELLKAVKTQQSLFNSSPANSREIDATEEIFEQTAAQLIVTEYKKTNGNIKRTAQVMQRIVPDKQNLQKVLPHIRNELVKLGIPLLEYYNLLSELGDLLSANESYHNFLQAGEASGISQNELLKELTSNPKQAAQLIILASEVTRINKNGGGEDLIRSLTDYVEKAGEAVIGGLHSDPSQVGKLSSMFFQMESALDKELEKRDLSEETKTLGRQKLKHRMQQSLSDIKYNAALSQLKKTDIDEEEKVRFLLEIFSDEKEMEEILELLKGSLDNDAIARDVSDQVLQKVRQEMAAKRDKAVSKELPPGVYVKAVLDFFIKFEISRAMRYDLPFSVVLVSFQGLPEDKEAHVKFGEGLRSLQNVLIRDLRKSIRDSDFVGYMSFNRFLVVFPMTQITDMEKVIRKFQDSLNRQVALPDGGRVWVRPRCGMASFNKESANTYKRIYEELIKSWQGDR